MHVRRRSMCTTPMGNSVDLLTITAYDESTPFKDRKGTHLSIGRPLTRRLSRGLCRVHQEGEEGTKRPFPPRTRTPVPLKLEDFYGSAPGF